ncbi:MAG: hypothetical protein COS88_03090 [Chloroflexi bacterium CG07_land_8_20_14_0_80_51_10]|nr:MAG: hypothetical protein COS88_03090 [Chloroflexi bacterium CG07_land_8_20_14_0_80_51_10]
MAAGDPDPAEIVGQEIDVERVKNAIGGLTQLQQEVISLRFGGEFSTAETAEVMGKSEGARVDASHLSEVLELRELGPHTC